MKRIKTELASEVIFCACDNCNNLATREINVIDGEYVCDTCAVKLAQAYRLAETFRGTDTSRREILSGVFEKLSKAYATR